MRQLVVSPPNLRVDLWFHPEIYACIQEVPPSLRLNTGHTPEPTPEYGKYPRTYP